jgi:uncharacterized protein (DUF58 family)
MKAEEHNPNIFISLQDLLKLEGLARGFSFLARKQKVKSILGGKHASKLRGRGLDFEEVRNYVAGDDIRNIDWKVTARTQKTHTRVFSEEKEKPALIIVDQSKSMFFGSQVKTKSVVAAELAALAAFRILKEGDRVGGVVFADQGTDIIYPKRDRRNILRFIEKVVERNNELADSKPVEFKEALRYTLKKVKNIVTHDFLIIVISDFHRYSSEVVQFIARLAQHNDVILAKVYDPMERELPGTQLIAGDGKKQVVLNAGKKALRKTYTGYFDQELRQFQAQMKKHKVPVMLFNTTDPIEKQLQEKLTVSVR